jgi:hypothetical protein
MLGFHHRPEGIIHPSDMKEKSVSKQNTKSIKSDYKRAMATSARP